MTFAKADRIANVLIKGFLWFVTAYGMAHLLVAAGVGR